MGGGGGSESFAFPQLGPEIQTRVLLDAVLASGNVAWEFDDVYNQIALR
jgi:hypothetical protein